MAQKNRPLAGRLFAHTSECSGGFPTHTPSSPTVLLAANNRYEVGKADKANQSAQADRLHGTLFVLP